jgi:serine carboxypeptidase-like clade 2
MQSGYINVNQQGERNLFYWLIEAENNPDTAPLVVWLQGGPGCSSLFGLFLENGPFKLQSNGTLTYNNLGWTQYANMLWIEAPAGVGFSYTSLPYNPTDESTAEDNYAFLQGFMEQYPQYQGRPLWITGESYAGVYVPTLTYLVLNNSNTALYEQMTGIMVGNPVFGCDSLYNTNLYVSLQFNYLYWHGLVSFSHFSNWTSQQCDQNPSQHICFSIYNDAVNEIGIIYQQLKKDSEDPALPSLDPDDLYQDFCTGNGTLDFTTGILDTCNPDGNQLSTYLNRADVQSAINARSTSWSVCADNLNYSTSGASMIPFYEAFINNKPSLKVLVYSGDVDTATVPFVYTQQCVSELPGGVTTGWQPWYVNEWTAGYVEVHEKFTYATVKGAGHEVPAYEPLNGINMFSRFLMNGNLDSHPVQDASSSLTKAKIQMEINKRLTQGSMLRKHGVRP